jgi:hypothetical protein
MRKCMHDLPRASLPRFLAAMTTLQPILEKRREQSLVVKSRRVDGIKFLCLSSHVIFHSSGGLCRRYVGAACPTCPAHNV